MKQKGNKGALSPLFPENEKLKKSKKAKQKNKWKRLTSYLKFYWSASHLGFGNGNDSNCSVSS